MFVRLVFEQENHVNVNSVVHCGWCHSIACYISRLEQRVLNDLWSARPFSPSSYDLATRTFFPSLLSASCLSFSVFLCVAGRACWRERGGGGEGVPKSYDSEKDWSSINHSILYGLDPGAKSHNGEKAWSSINHSILYGLYPRGGLYEATLLVCPTHGGFDHLSLDPKLQTNWSADRLIWLSADCFMNLRSNDKIQR